MSEKITTIQGGGEKPVPVFREFIGGDELITFIGDADIDADGANGQHGGRVAYNDTDTGSEFLKNGGMRRTPDGDVWFNTDWALDVIICNSLAQPKIFDFGMIASKTAYKIPGLDQDDPNAYIDSELIPYIAIPRVIQMKARGVVMGCLVECRNMRTGTVVQGMVADIGPRTKTGEVSIAMARSLGLLASPRVGGTDDYIIKYVIHPNKTYVGGAIREAYPLLPL